MALVLGGETIIVGRHRVLAQKGCSGKGAGGYDERDIQHAAMHQEGHTGSQNVEAEMNGRHIRAQGMWS